MAIYLSTIGVHLKYAVEAVAGTRPTTGYTDLVGVKSIPALTSAPDNLETTTLNETEYKTYIPGLKDLGGALSFTFNLSQDLKRPLGWINDSISSWSSSWKRNLV